MIESSFSSPLEETVVIVGVGLIGGSLAAALKRSGAARRVIGVGRDPARIRRACDSGLIDEAVTEISDVADRADVIVFCTPVERVAEGVRQAETALSIRLGSSDRTKPCLITDAGSVKAPICLELADISRFIGSHPIAGSHRKGFEAADSRLFEGRICVLTPTNSSSEQEIQRLERFWKAVGMQTVRMSASTHDRSLALTSHLPHVAASALAATLNVENRFLTGSGFRDTTRIAAGDPDLWTGILMQNAVHIGDVIDELQRNISAFREALSTRDAATIRDLLRKGQLSRDALDEAPRRLD